MKVFQFLAVQEPRLTARLAQSSASLDVVVVLDLEDALWDVTDERRTTDLKAEGREHLLGLVRDHADLFARGQFGVRLNRWSSPDAALDLDALARARRLVELDSIVLTKVESEADLIDWATSLRDHGIVYRALVPIVETRAGIANLEAIAEGARRLGIAWLVYGHYDFSLDSGWWPVPDHDQAAFWRHVGPLIERIERQGLCYVHPPFFQLHDMDRFEGILSRLDATCGREFGVITLGRGQTSWASGRARRGPASRVPPLTEVVSEDPDAHATRIVAAFMAGKRPDLSFAIDLPRGEFISPHIYLAAREHLGRLVDG